MDGWARFRRNRLALLGLVLVVVLALTAVLAPWVAPYDPARQSLVEKRARLARQRDGRVRALVHLERQTEILHQVVDREHRGLVLISHESGFAGLQPGGEPEKRPEDLFAIEAGRRSRGEQLSGRGAGDAEHRVRDELEAGRASKAAHVVDLPKAL